MAGRLLASPALHFVAIGVLLHVLVGVHEPPAAPAASDDELLYEAAVALGVDRYDRAVRERLARLSSFIGEQDGDPATLEEQARQIGLARSDLVVRRHLAEVMRLAAARLPAHLLPSEADVQAYYAAHAAELAAPPRLRLTHVFVSRARHGDDVGGAARTVLATLRSHGVAPDDAPAYGDAFVMGAQVGPITASDVDHRFGPGFAAALADAPPGHWVGPIASAYGLHLIWVHERIEPTTPPLEAVRSHIVHRLLRERQAAQTRARLAAMR
jgi:hypothetical protein